MKHFVEHDTKASRQYFALCLRLLCGNNFELNVFVVAKQVLPGWIPFWYIGI